MNNYLVFRLAAALAATGDIAAQPRRDSERWPARSAVLGLVGAALGVKRVDADAQLALQSGYDVAICVRTPGTLLRDYHTVQTVPSSTSRRPDSRAEALEAGRNKNALNTILTEREYREGMYVEVAMFARDTARWSFKDLVAALERPKYVLYFGRKSCPLTSPAFPVQISSPDVFSALETYAELEVHASSPENPPTRSDCFFTLDTSFELPDSNLAEQVKRWDIALDRERWHFAERHVNSVSSHVGGNKP